MPGLSICRMVSVAVHLSNPSSTILLDPFSVTPELVPVPSSPSVRLRLGRGDSSTPLDPRCLNLGLRPYLDRTTPPLGSGCLRDQRTGDHRRVRTISPIFVFRISQTWSSRTVLYDHRCPEKSSSTMSVKRQPGFLCLILTYPFSSQSSRFLQVVFFYY